MATGLLIQLPSCNYWKAAGKVFLGRGEGLISSIKRLREIWEFKILSLFISPQMSLTLCLRVYLIFSSVLVQWHEKSWHKRLGMAGHLTGEATPSLLQPALISALRYACPTAIEIRDSFNCCHRLSDFGVFGFSYVFVISLYTFLRAIKPTALIITITPCAGLDGAPHPHQNSHPPRTCKCKLTWE